LRDGKPRLLILAEPLDSVDAVQCKFISSFARALRPQFDVTIASSYIEPATRCSLRGEGFEVLCPEKDRYLLNRILARVGRRTESSLWVEAWLREAVGSANRRLMSRLLADADWTISVNATNTAVWPTDVWWAQGVPLNVTLASMSGQQGMRVVTGGPFRQIVRLLDDRMIDGLHKSAGTLIAASQYVKQFYEGLGFKVDHVINNLTDFKEFRPDARPHGSKYVLAYVGKETEIDTVNAVQASGVRVVAFGSKLLPGVSPDRLRKDVEFRGHVSQEDLVTLYSGAEFTIFPFTNEPLGYVPIESMACGTPVLTYNREGPSETVVDGQTGWLVDDAATFVRKASLLWKGFDKARFREASLRRAAQFTPEAQARLLTSILMRGSSFRPEVALA